jgi:hypothetical protein
MKISWNMQNEIAICKRRRFAQKREISKNGVLRLKILEYNKRSPTENFLTPTNGDIMAIKQKKRSDLTQFRPPDILTKHRWDM